MTVAQLIKRLQKEDPKRIVIVSIDGEGNGFSALHDITRQDWDPEEREIGEDGGFDNGKPALVLWP